MSVVIVGGVRYLRTEVKSTHMPASTSIHAVATMAQQGPMTWSNMVEDQLGVDVTEAAS